MFGYMFVDQTYMCGYVFGCQQYMFGYVFVMQKQYSICVMAATIHVWIGAGKSKIRAQINLWGSAISVWMSVCGGQRIHGWIRNQTYMYGHVFGLQSMWVYVTVSKTHVW